MSTREFSAEAWLARGIEAYQAKRFEEACEHFENALTIDSSSVQAHLALGAARLTLYKQRPAGISLDLAAEGDGGEREWAAYEQRERAILAEQNSTNWPLAEKSLKRANQLDPENELIIEYLCSLYFSWKDPLDEGNDRMSEAKRWLERLVEVRPDHQYANVYCGMILSARARKLLPNYGQYPTGPEPDLASLRRKAGPLLDEAGRHLARALALHGEQTAAPYLMEEVTSMRAYLADPDKAAENLRDKFEEMFRQQSLGAAMQSQVAGESELSSSSATITFELSPEAIAENRERPFPPNPWRIPVN
jgi:tetratricopeptide (TPR) repeat protein